MDWLAFLKDFGFPVTMAVGLLVLLTKNLEDVKNSVDNVEVKITDAIGKLSTNQTLIISMAARVNSVADGLSVNQIGIAHSMTDNQIAVADKLIAHQTELATKLAVNQADVASKLLAIQQSIEDSKNK